MRRIALWGAPEQLYETSFSPEPFRTISRTCVTAPFPNQARRRTHPSHWDFYVDKMSSPPRGRLRTVDCLLKVYPTVTLECYAFRVTLGSISSFCDARGWGPTL